MRSVFVYHSGGTEVAQLLDRRGYEAVVVGHEPVALRRAQAEARLLITDRTFPEPWPPDAPLMLVHALGVGVDGLAPLSTWPISAEIACARGLFATEAAEHIVAELCDWVRGTRVHGDRQKARQWVRFASGTLASRTAGLLGTGAIACRVAPILTALGMRVLGFSHSPRYESSGEGVGSRMGVEPAIERAASLDDLLRESDAVIVTVPLTPKTRGLLAARELARMKPGAFLVHLSRGGVVDEVALCEALASGHLGGASLDVFENEPIEQPSRLWTTPNLRITPHVAGFGLRYMERAVDRVIENVERAHSGRELLGLVDRRRGY